MVKVKVIKGWEEIPHKLGTKWKSANGNFVHGPRILDVSKVKDIRIYPINSKEVKGLKMPNKPKNATKVKVATIKKTGKRAVQSYLTPIVPK